MLPDTLIEKVYRLTPAQKKALEKMGLVALRDILFHFPSRYENPGLFKQIADLSSGEDVVVHGEVIKAKTSKAFRKKIPMGEAVISDGTGKIKAVWFHQPYLAKKFPEGSRVKLSGKVSERKGEIYLANPEIEHSDMPASPTFGEASSQSLFLGENQLTPIYPSSLGITSNWFYFHVGELLKKKIHQDIADLIPEEILKKYNLPSLGTALVWIHSPKNEKDALSARKRFAFEEIFFIQLSRLKDRMSYNELQSFPVSAPEKETEEFVSRFPFSCTKAQRKAIAKILDDFQSGHSMSRLLEGDVGSGKTAVAAVAAYATVRAGYEVAYMAPTEILARQHFESFIQYFSHMPVQVGLVTGSECRKFPSKIPSPSTPLGVSHTHISRPQLLKWVANGEIPILIGTHALISAQGGPASGRQKRKNVTFKNLALVIIDEQHRFGVRQRMALIKKHARVPHLLSMTATPIPRTLALTIYGDLDLSLLDEMPAGRKKVITEIVPPKEREAAYEKVRKEIMAGRQAFVICPRINEPDPEKEMAILAKSAKSEQKRLQNEIFPEFEVGLIHGKMKPAEKEKAMNDFLSGEIHILVSTSVVEVGVNIPNATVIIIEGAERFGLSQLHQLRGRVIRSVHQSYCFIFTESKSPSVLARLKAITTAKNGFELAEKDLLFRGAGSLTGVSQSGLSDLAMEALKNLKLVEAARAEAQKIIQSDPTLVSYPLIKSKISDKPDIHFE